MRVILLGLEPIVERYTEQWSRWLPDDLHSEGFEVVNVCGDRLSEVAGGVKTGEFLDAYDTCYWKATQAATAVEWLRSCPTRTGDVVLCTDAWNPALLLLRYATAVAGQRARVVGLLHAGVYDPNDLLARTQGLAGAWGLGLEGAMFGACDALCVATRAHAALLRSAHPTLNPHVLGAFPFHPSEWMLHATPWASRPKRVVFPHRLAPEKQPHFFQTLRVAYAARYKADDVEWVTTKEVCSSKGAYYSLLGASRCVFSAALQETWGIAMLEGASLGCYPVAPARLSYIDTLPVHCLYETVEQAVEQVHAALNATTMFSHTVPWEAEGLPRLAALLREHAQ